MFALESTPPSSCRLRRRRTCPSRARSGAGRISCGRARARRQMRLLVDFDTIGSWEPPSVPLDVAHRRPSSKEQKETTSASSACVRRFAGSSVRSRRRSRTGSCRSRPSAASAPPRASATALGASAVPGRARPRVLLPRCDLPEAPPRRLPGRGRLGRLGRHARRPQGELAGDEVAAEVEPVRALKARSASLATTVPPTPRQLR